MPPLLAAVLVGAGLYAGLRLAARVLDHLDGSPERVSEAHPQSSATEAPVAEKDLGALELDPATGVYRPSSRHN
jgi:hypothetical protein